LKNLNPSDHFINSTAKLIQCPKCKGWIYECQVNGWRTRVEPTPLNLSDEIAWRLASRKIYQTIQKGSDFELEPRTLWQVTKGDPKAIVLGSHDCKFPTIFEPEPLFAPTSQKEPNF